MLSCPACGNRQKEVARALSSICRSCGEYFKIANGKALANKPPALNPFGNKLAPTPAAVEAEPPVTDEFEPVNRLEETSEPPADQGVELIRSTPEPKPEPVESTPRQKEREAERDIECLDCGHPHTYRGDATSAPCPGCGTNIPLKDYVINERWTFRVQTQGDVLIGRKGHVRGAAIQCHNLTIHGDFDGAADCTGELHVFKSATISGRVRAKCLFVAERADLTLSHPAKVEELVVKGTILGTVECSGRVILHRDAIVEGDIKAGSLVIDPGAQHTGLVHMTGLSIAEQVANAMAEED